MRRKTTIVAVCGTVCCLCASVQASIIADSYGWVDAGLSITPGSYQLTASGEWTVQLGVWPFVTATGSDALLPGQYDEYFAGAQKAELVAYVGTTAPGNFKADADTPGYYAIVDGSQTVNFLQSGELWFVINDDAVSGLWADNSGAIDVTVNGVDVNGTLTGDGVVAPVPETSSLITTAFLLFPLGLQGFRYLRTRKQVL